MNSSLRWVLGVSGLFLLMVSPYLWNVNPLFLWFICPLLSIWAFWLMLEYLRWAKTLGKK